LKNILFKIEYLGTNYKGWQVQTPKIVTIEDEIEKILKQVFSEQIKLKACSRTDSGVHARGQVANCFIPRKASLKKLFFSCNSLLPVDITIVDLVEVSADFSARFNNQGKRYLYRIVNSPYPNAIGSNLSWWVRHPLNLEVMKKASLALLGEHDFSAFRGKNCQSHSPIKTIHKIDLIEKIVEGYREILILYEGSGFLRNMVRIMTGGLVEIGKGKIQPDSMQKFITEKTRNHTLVTAPAHGLILDKIFYQPDPFLTRGYDSWDRD
jgi:tRNA pseudouridine38-40 synthase